MNDVIMAVIILIFGIFAGYAIGVNEGQSDVYYERVICSPDLAKKLVCISNPNKKEN